MFDYSFFALLFLLASSLAPNASTERTWVNSRYPEQSISWTREGEGWSMRVNGREIGVFHRHGDAIVHHTGSGPPRSFPIAELAAPPSPGARRAVLRGRFAPTVLTIRRSQGRLELVDPSRELLRVPLILQAR